MIDSKEYFEQNNFLVIDGLLPTNIANLFYEYSKTVVASVDHKIKYAKEYHNAMWDGGFDDGQVANTFFRYGDPLMDTLMMVVLDKVQQHTGLTLSPNYSYWRFYQKDDELKRHLDRGSCEISATICLGYDTSNVCQDKYPDYNWPMYIKHHTGEEIPIHLKAGDCIIYRGMDVEHWRDRFLGLNHTQVFIHYNDVNGPIDSFLDGRELIGVPKRKYELEDK